LVFRILTASLAVLVLSVLLTVLYMVVYGNVINPGHPQTVYDAHVQRAGPYLSIVFGVPLMYFACLRTARWGAREKAMRTALLIWVVYVAIDAAILVGSGALATATTETRIIAVVSQLAKLAAAFAAGRRVTGGSV
jgi:hypothetical protein